MNVKLFWILLLLLLSPFSKSQQLEDNLTPTYSEIINFYDSLENSYNQARLIEIGKSDIGKPIHLFIIDSDQEFKPVALSKRKKVYYLINNGIHAGEACGIEASMKLASDLLSNPSYKIFLDNVVVLIIPVYNISGSLYRNSFTRVNQNGPEEYGFRGNIRNLDLNRDFIKADSKNASSFNSFYTQWDPDVFVETHTTNGSNHSYTLTLIGSQKDKLNPEISAYQYQKMTPALFDDMEKKSKSIIPYVFPINKDPKDGIKSFLETARYSSGYTSLFDSYSFITEAHSYKSYPERTIHTYEFLKSMLAYLDQDSKAVLKSRKRAKEFTEKRKVFPLNFVLDSSYSESLRFRGYNKKPIESNIVSHQIYTYDTLDSYDTIIPYFNQYKSTISISKPKYYVIPQAYTKVIERLKWNGIELDTLKKDSSIEGTNYYIADYKSVKNPYEGHYLHYDINVTKKVEKRLFFKGDYLVNANQTNIRYIVETLEPQSIDGFFAWNFFDGILQQKEWYSDFSFVPKAEDLLAENDSLRLEFEAKIKQDSSFAENDSKKLYFLYKSSKYYEKSAFRYPIIRIEEEDY